MSKKLKLSFIMPIVLCTILINFSDLSNTNSENGSVNNDNIRIQRRNVTSNNSSISYVDDYIEQSFKEVEQAEIPDEYLDNSSSDSSNPNVDESIRPSNWYYDNGHTDDKKEKANIINYKNGFIIGTLNTNDRWTQFWHGIGERDEDYYRFSAREKLEYTFEFVNPSDYHIRILKFGRDEFICSAQSTFSIELEPATYYLHVYTNNTSAIVSENYTITYTSQRISNLNSFDMNDANKAIYKMAIWENEIWPSNSTRWKYPTSILRRYEKTRRNTTTTGYFDPLFSNGNNDLTPTDEIFLDSIIFIWDKNIAVEISEFLVLLYYETEEVMKEKQKQEAKIKLLYDGIELLVEFVFSPFESIVKAFTISNYAYKVIKSIFSDGMDIDYDIIDGLNSCRFGAFIGSLNSACGWLANSTDENNYLSIPRFFYFEEDTIFSSSKYKLYYWYRNYIFYPQQLSILYDFRASGNISNIQTFGDLNSYYGNITAFESYNEFNDYINGQYDNGDSAEETDFHSYTEHEIYNEFYHKSTCDCGAIKLSEHSYDFIDGIYKCVVCDYALTIETDTISISDYGYSGQYLFDPETKGIITQKGDLVTTNRLRCGIINGNLTLSAKRKDAGTAYLEYHFAKSIIELKYDFGLWSENEYLIENSSIRLEGYDEDDSSWYTIREFSAKRLSTSYSELNSYTDVLVIPTKSFRFIVETNSVNNDNNRGRVVIGNIEVTKLVNEHIHQYTTFEKHNNSTHKEVCSCGDYKYDNHMTGPTYKVGSKTYANCLECGQVVDVSSAIIVTPFSIAKGDGMFI